MTKHPFHIVTPSPYPLLTAASAHFTVYSLVFWWTFYPAYRLCPFGYLSLLLFVSLWWGNVVRESTMLGSHTDRVQAGLRLGIFLFLVSELFFFLGFFWSYLHCSLSPNVELGSIWPPPGVSSVSPFHVPLLNTVLLLSSGATVTWSHFSLLSGQTSSRLTSLGLTLLLGVFFSSLQLFEYYISSFCISDSVFGSCFFLATGFHGIHVLIGTLFLLVAFLRIINFHFSPSRHLGFLFACWYWHFVDVIWILLYLIFYVWGA